nr:tRNA pseudouridine(13) synthase TruD [Candidatus Acidianus copahuensis]
MERYIHDWEPLEAEIPRPQGFEVIEEIDYLSCLNWKGKNNIGKYAVYLLEKNDIDHFTALRKLNVLLRTKVNYIGIKDSAAHTYQLIYIRPPIRIQEYKEDRINLRFLGYTDSKFNHTGNIFNIVLKRVNKDKLSKRVTDISSDPYLPAFFGYQRFGSRRPITHIVGKYLVKRDWYNAIMFILGHPFDDESENIKKARKMVMNGELLEALKEIPISFKQERTILKNYIKTNNPFQALKTSLIPLSFYVEAYQSYIFNKILSRKLNNVINDKDKVEIIISSKDNLCDEDCKLVFEEEGIEGKQFNIREIKVNRPYLKRKAFMKVRDIKFKDETLSFALDRGMYATIVLEELLRLDPRKIT